MRELIRSPTVFGVSIPFEGIVMNFSLVVARAAFMTLALLLQACAGTYSAKPITATVVDAETGEPMEGVNVLAHWTLNRPPSWRSVGELELIETTTDKNGKFHIAGWEGKSVPSDYPPGTKLGNEDPGIRLFKSGYRPAGLSNTMQADRLNPGGHQQIRYSDWDGRIIKIEKFNGDLDMYALVASGATSGIHYQNCTWVKMRRMLISLFRERDRLDGRLRGVSNPLPRYRDFKEQYGHDCGQTEVIFADYLQ